MGEIPQRTSLRAGSRKRAYVRVIEYQAAVPARGYVSWLLPWNDIRAVATWKGIDRPMPRGLHNIALRLSDAYEGQHHRC